VAQEFGGWLAPALLLYAAQRIARSKPMPSECPIPGAPDREVRGTFTLESVVVGGPDGLPRSVPLDLELRAGDSLAILCDVPDEGVVLAEVLCGRRAPLAGQVTVDGAPLRPEDRLVALVGRGEIFVPGPLDDNLAALGDRSLDRSTLEAVHETCALAEVVQSLAGRDLAADGEPLSAFHRLLVLVARVVPSPYRVLVVVDPMPWVNDVAVPPGRAQADGRTGRLARTIHEPSAAGRDAQRVATLSRFVRSTYSQYASALSSCEIDATLAPRSLRDQRS
jgi:hypothetical protein